MNFAKRTHDVVAGKITQYRIPVGEPRRVKRPGPRGKAGAGERTGRSAVRWQYPAAPKVGKVFVVKRAAGLDPAVYATITDVRREWLGEIDFAGAKACGHRTTDDFKLAWTRSADRISDSDERWALRELSDDGLRDALLARFTRRHAATEVWVVSFRVSEGRDRFLAAGSRGGDYTTTPARALDPDAPCVGDLELARMAKEAEAHRLKFRAALEAERAERKAERGRSMRDAA